MPQVRKELGYPPLVTPMSQIVGTQAVLNIVTGERYKIKTKEIKDYVKVFTDVLLCQSSRMFGK